MSVQRKLSEEAIRRIAMKLEETPGTVFVGMHGIINGEAFVRAVTVVVRGYLDETKE